MKANLASKLQSIYAQAKVCQNSSCISFDPDITDIFAHSRDYDQLLDIWKGWHDSTGPKMRKMYAQIVELENKAARETGYTDLSQFWMEDFEDDDFENTYDNLFEKVKPIYDQLHLYVRNKLRKVYGSKYPKNHDENLIPAHLLGQMWAQQWNNILDLVLPYPNEKQVDVTSLLIKNNYTVNKLFKVRTLLINYYILSKKLEINFKIQIN
jgi:peptidyl-dipeptidase A